MDGPTEEQEVIGDLLLSVLAVNGWSVERVYGLREGLAGQDLLRPDSMARMEAKEIADRLHEAGYRRGALNKMMASRLSQLSRSLTASRRKLLVNALEARDEKALRLLLLPLSGVGPVVMGQFFVLRDLHR